MPHEIKTQYGREEYIQSLVDQYNGIEQNNSLEEMMDILDPVFAGMSSEDRASLAEEFRLRMIVWNANLMDKKHSTNPYTGIFRYLDVTSGLGLKK